MTLLPLAITEDMVGILGGVFVTMLVVMIPIILAFLKHQQRMTELLRSGKEQEGLGDKVDRLAREVNQLTQIVNQQAIALDDLVSPSRSTVPPPVPVAELQERLKG